MKDWDSEIEKNLGVIRFIYEMFEDSHRNADRKTLDCFWLDGHPCHKRELYNK